MVCIYHETPPSAVLHTHKHGQCFKWYIVLDHGQLIHESDDMVYLPNQVSNFDLNLDDHGGVKKHHKSDDWCYNAFDSPILYAHC